MRSELQSRIAHELAHRFEAVGIRYAVVHGLEHYPAFPNRDLDLLVHDDQVEGAIDEAQRHFESQQLRFVAQRRINGSCWCFVAAPGVSTVCEFDLIPRLRWGPAILVNGPRPLSTIGIFRVDPWASFVKRVLIQLLGGNIAKLARRPDELALSDAEREHVPEMLAGYLGQPLAATLIKTIDGRDIDNLRVMVPALRRAVTTRSLLRRPGSIVPATVDWIRNELSVSPFAKPIVPVVAIVGVDGVGKSTLVDGVQRELRDRLPILDVETRHWRPSLLRSLRRLLNRQQGPEAGEAVPPRRSPGHGQLLRLAYYALDFWIGGWWRDRRAAVRLIAVVYDRCILDMIVDPVRFGLRSAFGVRFVHRIVPAPDLVVLLHDDPDRIRARKSELEVAEISHQQSAWLALAAQGDVHVVLSAQEPRHALAARVVDHVIDRFFGHASQHGPVSLVHAIDDRVVPASTARNGRCE
jgi:thymidylate kinase